MSKETPTKVEITKEQKKLNLKGKRRNIGLVINLFCSSSVLISLLILSIVSTILFIVIREEYMLSIVDSIEKNLKTTIEDLIKQAIDTIKENLDPDDVYDQILSTLKTITVTINGETQNLNHEQVIELFEKMIPRENFSQVFEDYLNSEQINLENINLEFIKDLIRKLNLNQYNEIIKIVLIVTSYLTIINILNAVLASRLLVVDGKVSKHLILASSIMTLNLINIIGLIIFNVNNKKAIE
ncbi:hypothetical protein CK556_02075 [Mesoplasma chauliocola]|uniref:Uncharacterized protein n=1 Tax=Mesoplasma chauliocola TaxID=216427 RepID=A0A249SNH3_9MOLU|nr:hypothetical protein [Mesoplasma chauliocola]ASZ09143.1 hypothetical protein CK556_02075 [Mesoplasma chauliocola]